MTIRTLKRPDGDAPEDFHLSRRGLGAVFFAGYAVAAMSAEAAPIVTDDKGLTIETVKLPTKGTQIPAYVARPADKAKHPVVIVVNEIFGIHDYIKDTCRRLAKLGYVAIAPDLLSGMGPNGGGTSDVATKGNNAVGVAIRELPPDQITADLNATADYVAKLPASNGKLAVGGFCWGGTQTFRYATNNPSLKAAFVFYGSAPMTGNALPVDKTALAKISAPVYGFYAGNDARINATVPATVEAMKELNKTYDVVTYDGAGHGFMRAGEAPEPAAPAAKGDAEADKTAKAAYDTALIAYKANRKARDEAWTRLKALLAKL